MAEALRDAAISGIADRVPVDWDALEREAQTDDDRQVLKWLRVLGDVANVHQTATLDTADSDRKSAPPEPTRAPSLAPSLALARPPALSETWGRYRLDECVGEGGFGSVYRAWDPELEREVALKILHQRVWDAEVQSTVRREGRALAKVRHPNVVGVLSTEAHGEQIALCMEYVRGETLEKALGRNGPFSPRHATIICQDVCRALAAVHLAGYIHRDIKARNVMQERGGRIVLMDFGAGREAQHLLLGNINMVGTPLYMAPEVLAGDPATAGSDVYSVGVLLYHLVTEEYPVEGSTLKEIQAAHMQGRRRLLAEHRPDLPLPFVQVVDKALAADPARRYGTAAALLQALVGVLDERKLQIAPTMAASILRWLGRGAIVLLSILALGALTSRHFNLSLGLSGFVNEGPWDWFTWGATSLVKPIVLVLSAGLLLTAVSAGRRLLVNTLPAVRKVDERIARQIGHTVAAVRLTEPSVFSSVALLIMCVALVVQCVRFWPLLRAIFGEVSTADISALEALAPRHIDTHASYRDTFALTTGFIAFGWYLIASRLPRRKDAFQKALPWGAAAVFAISLLLLSLPFRMLGFTDFPVAQWRQESCSLLAERSNDAMLFCPSLAPPRVRLVDRAQEPVTLVNRTESMFATF